MSVRTVMQAFIGFDIIVDLNIGCKPDILTGRKLFADFLDMLPVVVIVEFVRQVLLA